MSTNQSPFVAKLIVRADRGRDEQEANPNSVRQVNSKTMRGIRGGWGFQVLGAVVACLLWAQSASAVTTLVGGDLNLSSTDLTQIAIAGPTSGIPATPSTDHDRMIVTGHAHLAGTLEVNLTNGFTPSLGQQFTILTAASLSGEFTSYQGDLFRIGTSSLALVPVVIPAGGGLAQGEVRLMTTFLGDANVDGQVNLTDFARLQNHISQPGDWSDGDFNGDGWVTYADFTLMQNNYGLVTLFTQPQPAAAVIPNPEPNPAALALIALAALTLTPFTRRRPQPRGCRAV